MTSTDHELQPIVLTIDVDASPAQCYRRFAEEFGEWWPAFTHSLSRETATRCALEARAGGRVFETTPDGTEHLWGNVTAVQPGKALSFTWHPGREAASAQSVELGFEPRGCGCRVRLTHGDWHLLGEIAPLLRREYLAGWQYVFGELYARYAGRPP